MRRKTLFAGFAAVAALALLLAWSPWCRPQSESPPTAQRMHPDTLMRLGRISFDQILEGSHCSMFIGACTLQKKNLGFLNLHGMKEVVFEDVRAFIDARGPQAQPATSLGALLDEAVQATARGPVNPRHTRFREVIIKLVDADGETSLAARSMCLSADGNGLKIKDGRLSRNGVLVRRGNFNFPFGRAEG